MVSGSNVDECNAIIRAKAFDEDYSAWRYRETIEVLDNAFVIPQDYFGSSDEFAARSKFPIVVFNGGVYRDDLLIVSSGLTHGKVALKHIPDAIQNVPKHTQSLRGTWIYGGFHYRQFGHSLTESVGRLWFLEKYKYPVNGVIFNCFTGRSRYENETNAEDWLQKIGQIAARQTFFKEILKLFGAEIPVHFVTKPICVDSLVVPSQLMGLIPYGDFMGGHHTYRNHIKRRIDNLIANKGSQNSTHIYVSRSKYKRDSVLNGFLMEDLLDLNFMNSGYKVIYPELMTLEDQILTYRGATHIVMVAGSACHVAALALNGQQDMVILKRFYKQSDQFTSQCRLMGARSVEMVDCLSGSFAPSDCQIHPSLLSYSIDFNKLWDRLLGLGFVDQPLVDDGSQAFPERAKRLCEILDQNFNTNGFRHIPNN